MSNSQRFKEHFASWGWLFSYSVSLCDMLEGAINKELRQIHVKKRKLRPYLFYKKASF
jgi:hypothetical protein